ncbi:MAG: HipA N-terminal domain-containing protein [Alphaproteobacteria bacterium]|nr:HipA N-terminal domain-containing protein [Alphaproteobacteria bacterium]
MKTLGVRYCGWGEDRLWGTLADDGRTLLFEYSEQALAEGLNLSPRHLPLSTQSFGGFPMHQWRLPGLIADALPDGWGLLLMDRLFRQQGLTPTPLDRWAFLVDRAMGALRFEPHVEVGDAVESWSLLKLANESASVMSGKATELLPSLIKMGGSPQGVRPKALVLYDAATQQVSTRANDPGQ